ncbi:uncharacterized protein BJ212DRAFT_1476231 [Suillus subaureus]|uniref:Uncharacterized protein n=1 Tax=Suillus subaureus TaxID=48587 RepID=A0A9P7EL58_9AGAM|nr:uncharacterized protein BJ212DRAFT_1476231 [Suillus subaureus]KAG1824947.1 hypothetical protein BJ212DRAFT_1476231 [Suillus subaureus]
MYPFQQYSQVPPSVPSNLPSAQPAPQSSQQPTGQALAAQRTTQLIAGQFPPVQAEQQYPAQQPQPHFSPPPTQSQFQIQQTQFPPTPQFSQSQAQARPQSQFSQPHHPHVPTQSHAHPHVPAHAQPQPQVHTPPNPPQQSQHYSGPSDSYYLQSDMYYAMNTQGSQSAPSLVSVFLLLFGFGLWDVFLDGGGHVLPLCLVLFLGYAGLDGMTFIYAPVHGHSPYILRLVIVPSLIVMG